MKIPSLPGKYHQNGGFSMGYVSFRECRLLGVENFEDTPEWVDDIELESCIHVVVGLWWEKASIVRKLLISIQTKFWKVINLHWWIIENSKCLWWCDFSFMSFITWHLLQLPLLQKWLSLTMECILNMTKLAIHFGHPIFFELPSIFSLWMTPKPWRYPKLPNFG